MWRKGSLGRMLLPRSCLSLCLLKLYHGSHFCSLPLLSPPFPSAKWQVAVYLAFELDPWCSFSFTLRWVGSHCIAADLASCCSVAVYPTKGVALLRLRLPDTSEEVSEPVHMALPCSFQCFSFSSYFWFILGRWLRPEPVIKSVGEMWVHSQMVNHTPVLGSCAPGNCHDMALFWRADFLYDWQKNLMSVHVYAGLNL